MTNLRCSISGCSDDASTIHGGYSYCSEHLADLFEVPYHHALNADQRHAAVEIFQNAYEEVDERKLDDEAGLKAWHQFQVTIVHMILHGEVDFVDRHYNLVMSEYGLVASLDSDSAPE